MNKAVSGNAGITPFSLRDAPSLIEKAWPVAKISAETQKERKAGSGQTLTGLGSYWKGRKPLILTRACILAILMPATNHPEQDVRIFERLMGMADESFGRRFTDSATIFARIFPGQPQKVASVVNFKWKEKMWARQTVSAQNLFEEDQKDIPDDVWHDLKDLANSKKVKGNPEEFVKAFPDEWKTFIDARWRTDMSRKKFEGRIAHILANLSYTERLKHVKRPEEIPESTLLAGIWNEVNDHLGTSAKSINELVEQLGIMRFGQRPKFADPFCGSGSIPYEAARMGCEAHASDLNPVACMLTWGAFNIVGASSDEHEQMQVRQALMMKKINTEITELKVEHDTSGNRAKVFLYCLETKCPRTEWMVPLAPSWVISKPRRIIAQLIPDQENKRYDFRIVENASDQDMNDADQGTVRNGRMYHPILQDSLGISIKEIRGDYKDDKSNNRNALRLWEKHDFMPRPNDIWQERLYAIQWLDGEDIKERKANPRTWFAVPTQDDLDREEQVRDIVAENLSDWQEQGLVPDMEIQPGNKTTELIRTRGWTHWHHLFNPRHLLLNAITAEYAKEHPETCLGLACLADRNARTSHWNPGRETGEKTFANQALNTMLNYPVRGFSYTESLLKTQPEGGKVEHANIRSISASDCKFGSDILITDPPYADAVQYDEITEFFIAWLRKNPPAPFNQWQWDSRRNIAIKGKGQSFKEGMIEAFKAIAGQVPDNGIQIVQFTHQDTETWSDMAQIFWGAGLRVMQDWYVSTETTSELKKGGYVQGTHMIVLKKCQVGHSGYENEIAVEIRNEVERQIAEMAGLNEKMNANYGERIFGEADLQMAGYAAALRVLTAYTKIEGRDMTREALHQRKKGEKNLITDLTGFAVKTANEFLVPQGLKQDVWFGLNKAERFYLKMMDIESGEFAKLEQFQNFAKAFEVTDYDVMMASRLPNDARLKTAIEFRGTAMNEGSLFGQGSIIRLVLRAIWRISKEDDADDVLEDLRDNIPGYLQKHETIGQVVAYVADKRASSYPNEASAARSLTTALRMEQI